RARTHRDALSSEDYDHHRQHGAPMREQHRGIDEHPDRYEEDGEKEVSHRFDERFNPRRFAGFGDEGTGDEGTERNRIPKRERRERGGETDSDAGNERHV